MENEKEYKVPDRVIVWLPISGEQVEFNTHIQEEVQVRTTKSGVNVYGYVYMDEELMMRVRSASAGNEYKPMQFPIGLSKVDTIAYTMSPDILN